MMKNSVTPLPKRNIIKLTDGVQYKIKGNILYVWLNDVFINSELCDLMKNDNIENIKLRYKGSINQLNILFQQLTSDIFKQQILVELDSSVHIHKNTFLAIDELPNNVKLSVYSHVSTDETELNTWALNLSEKDFQILYGKINNENMALRIRCERQIAREVYLKLSEHVDFSKMSDTQKMNYMFDYVLRKYPYNWNLIGSDGNYRNGADRSLGSDPVKVYKNGTGVCTGRSRLLKILLNNPYMNVSCFTASGLSGNLEHEWNEFIDENGNIFAYDLSFGIKHASDITKEVGSRIIKKRSHVVEEQIRNQPSALPPRKTKRIIPNLPPRSQ